MAYDPMSLVWDSEVAFVQTHLATGLRFACVKRAYSKGGRTFHRWHASIENAVIQQSKIDNEANACGMYPDEFVEFLREIALLFAVEEEAAYASSLA